MSDDTRFGFNFIAPVAKAAARNEQIDVDDAVQLALLDFGRGRLAQRDIDSQDPGPVDDGVNFGFDTTDTDDVLF